MKKIIPLFKYAEYTILIAIGIMGAISGSAAIDRYPAVVNGILGLVIVYLMYRLFLSSKREPDKEINSYILSKFPKNIMYVF
jgi:uncharacterized membrane protein YfcA